MQQSTIFQLKFQYFFFSNSDPAKSRFSFFKFIFSKVYKGLEDFPLKYKQFFKNSGPIKNIYIYIYLVHILKVKKSQNFVCGLPIGIHPAGRSENNS
jgi:hypothetical protein